MTINNKKNQPLINKKILLGITGGIAAYKTCSLVGLLHKFGADVKVIMTPAATEFVGPLTFQALTHHPVYIEMLKPINQEEVEHIALAQWCDLAIIAPATANTIGKLANGLCDNLLTTVFTAIPKSTPIIIAPAMNVEMWENEFVQENIKKLKKTNRYFFVDPICGRLACGYIANGKIADNEIILEEIKKRLK